MATIPKNFPSDAPIARNPAELAQALHNLDPRQTMNRNRPYKGQMHTWLGIRGQAQVSGITMRDIWDCYVRGCVLAHPVFDSKTRTIQPNREFYDEAEKGEAANLSSNDLYKLQGDVDPVAVLQNMLCEIEKLMGTFPNTRAACQPLDRRVSDAVPE